MSTGILTFHNGINYGGFFQTYALKQAIESLGESDVRVINYRSYGAEWQEWLYHVRPKGLTPWHFRQSLYAVAKVARFKRAHRKLDLTSRVTRSAGLQRLSFDTAVLGSDEIWNAGSGPDNTYDPAFFGAGIAARRCISYAASFGSTNRVEEVPLPLRDAVRGLDAVSVRDENSLRLVREIGRHDAGLVLDPTFLIELKREAVPCSERGFILVYGYFDDATSRAIMDYARRIGKRTISVCYPRPWCDVSYDSLSPFQWLGFFEACDCVITTMFHGMVFSVQHSKPFAMFRTSYRDHKVGAFLDDIGFSRQYIENSEAIDSAFGSHIDYPQAQEVLAQRRGASLRYLSEGIGPCR